MLFKHKFFVWNNGRPVWILIFLFIMTAAKNYCTDTEYKYSQQIVLLLSLSLSLLLSLAFVVGLTYNAEVNNKQ